MSNDRSPIDVRELMSRPAAGSASVLRIAYEEEHYADADEAIAGMRERMLDGWRVAVIRGPRNGPFAVVYQREVHRDY